MQRERLYAVHIAVLSGIDAHFVRILFCHLSLCFFNFYFFE